MPLSHHFITLQGVCLDVTVDSEAEEPASATSPGAAGYFEVTRLEVEEIDILDLLIDGFKVDPDNINVAIQAAIEAQREAECPDLD